MHKTAFNIGGLAIQTYGSGAGTRILEIGAYDVNGSLRQHVKPDMHYVGVDIEAGPGVDIVVELGKPLPFDAESFDLILASSVFEHDPAFWSTFLELTRVVRKGGYIYINAPSNGGFHRFPEDHWRFYPDSGMALERWATSQDLPVELIESFLCEQDEDNWNDFSAIFRRLPANEPRPRETIHSQVPSFNIHTAGSTELLRMQGETQDMLLFSAAQGELHQQQHDRELILLDLEQTRERLNTATHEIQQHQQACNVAQLSLDEVRGQLDDATLEATKLTAKLAESEGWLVELAKFRTDAQRQISSLEKALSKSNSLATEQDRQIARQVDELQNSQEQLAHLDIELENLRSVNHEQDSQINQLQKRERELTAFGHEQERLYRQSDEALRHAEATTAARTTEVHTLNRQVAESEERAAEKEWLRCVHIVLASQPFWWWLLPPSWRHARELKLLLSNGLFDADSYLTHYPDVADFGMDPLRHYIWHGMVEGRRRHFH
jgi:SAM-dependent methyltransferase